MTKRVPPDTLHATNDSNTIPVTRDPCAGPSGPRGASNTSSSTMSAPLSHERKSHRRKKPRSTTTSSSSSTEPFYKERRVGELLREELADFNAWIAQSANESPPVAGAGAAKRFPDADLHIFRDRNVHGQPVFPMVRSDSADVRSPSPQKRTKRLVDELLREAESVVLPPVASPTPELEQDKALMHQLLSECKAIPTPPPAGNTSQNQLSGRSQEASKEVRIPIDVFYQRNSFVGRERIDLSDWMPLLADADDETKPLLIQAIGDRITHNCVDLSLCGMAGITNPSGFEPLLRHGAHLHRLDLSRSRGIGKAAWQVITTQCPLVNSLCVADVDSFTDDVLLTILSSFSGLKTLDITRCYRITDAGVIKAAKIQGLHLERIRIDSCVHVTDRAIDALIASRGSSLKTLSVRSIRAVSDGNLKNLLLRHPKHLEELNLSGCTKLTDTSFDFFGSVPTYYGTKVAPGYHAMQWMDLSDCARLTSLSCCFVAAACPFLVSFRAARCVLLCDKAVVALASLMRLEELDLSGCSKITDKALARFIHTDGLQQTTTTTPAIKPKSLRRLILAKCIGLGESTVDAIQALSSTLVELDVSGIANIPPQSLVKMFKSCRKLEVLHCRGQAGVNRAVLTYLATSNRSLRVLDIRECPAVDDLALYPLAVMQSLLDVRLTGESSAGSSSLTSKGLMNLPSTLKHLTLCGFSVSQLDDAAINAVLTNRRFQQLETLDMSSCCGFSIQAIDHILQQCPILRSINTHRCDQIKALHLARALRDDTLRPVSLPPFTGPMPSRRQRYGVDVIDDSAAQFRGLASQRAEISEHARRREEAYLEETKQQRAASTIQFRFRTRARAVWKAHQKKEQEWREFCGAVDIQRMARGFLARKFYRFLRDQLTRAVIFLQYKWRQRMQQRRIRKATSYWTNQLVLKVFLRWKHLYTAERQAKEYALAVEKAAKALNFWGEKTIERVFHAWRTFVQKKSVKAKKAIGFWKCQSLPRVMEAWANWTRAQYRHRHQLASVFLNVAELETHNSSRQLAQAALAKFKAKRVVIRRWQEFVVDQKRFLLKASLSILSGSLLHWSFRQWRQNAIQQRGVRDKHKRLVQKLVHRGLYRSWLGWREFVHERKAKKRALLKFSASIVAKCWLKWKASHEHTQRLKNVSHTVAKRLTQQQLVRAVGTWFEFTQAQVEQRQRLRRALAFFTNATLLRTFTSWAAFAAHLVSLRARWRARMQNANVHYAMTQWCDYIRLRRELHTYATKLQAFWRGHASRRRTEDHYFYMVWAAVLIQNAWRGRLARAILRVAGRKARLKEYLRAERERDGMAHEEALTRQFNHELDMIITLQRMWRGVAARALFIEVRRARILLKKQQEAEQQEIVRALARQRQLQRQQEAKKRELAAIEIQRIARGFLARRAFEGKKELLHQRRCAMRLQAMYRGRMSRRRTAALRRSYLTRMEILARRTVEGKALRALGAQTRATQRPLRSFLSFFGLDPSSFLTDVRELLKEVREDFQSLTRFFDAVKTRVLANEKRVKQEATDEAKPQPSKGKFGLPTAPVGMLKKTDTARRFLRDLEQIMAATASKQQKQDELLQPGDAVRIVLRGHPRCGETAYILAITEQIAQVKLDVDGELEFFPLFLPATRVEAVKRVLHKVPDLAFHAASLLGRSSAVSPIWRQQLEAYAASIADEAKRFNAARVIQCAARVYLARVRVQEELEFQGIQATRRQQVLVRTLKAFKLANTRMTNVLLQLHFIRPRDIPGVQLDDEPLEVQKLVNRCQRWLARRQEIHQAMLKLLPETFKGAGPLHGREMPVPPIRVVDKLVHYPLKWLQRVTRVPFARMLEKSGQHEIARFLGGVEFAKSFDESNVEAHAHFFKQLQHCSFCASDGWAVVHGVFQKRKQFLDTTYTQENRLKKKSKTSTKRVPHGWGVAHFLTGSVGRDNRKNWLERNSIEAQFKSLHVVKQMKHEEREQRLTTQILARQGTLNTLRSTEGARGFAKRHAELSLLEEKTIAFYARYQQEIALHEREEQLMFDEEDRVNALIAKEREELRSQGHALYQLQQQVPEVVTDVEMVASTKTPLEFLRGGVHFEVEYDDEIWYDCEILGLDVYEDMVAEVLYVEDQRKEKIKLLPASVVDEHKQFLQQQGKKSRQPKSVAAITAAASAKAANAEIPFRKWRAGKAIEVVWATPPENGARIFQYVVEWKDENDAAVVGKSVVKNDDEENEDSDTKPAPTTTTLWPIPAHCERSLRVRVAAENAKGVGLASVFVPLPVDLLNDVSHASAVPLLRPPPDTTGLEKQERKSMEREDEISRALQQELTCTICGSAGFGCASEVHEHVAREHSVPLICPFKSCYQVCASERALRYHIWRCTIPKPTQEEEQSELFMEILNISRQYCLRKDHRHAGQLKKTAEQAEEPDGGERSLARAEEVFLEGKYQLAYVAWIASGRTLHEKRLKQNERERQRRLKNKYIPPSPLFGVDFVDPEVITGRREAVLATIRLLQEDLDTFKFETATQLDKLRHEEKELVEYIALKAKRMKTTEEDWQKQSLKREKKKAQKTLDTVKANITSLVTTSTEKIDEMTAEIQRLATIEKAFVPFIHQLVRVNRLTTVLQSTYTKALTTQESHRVVLDHFQEDLRKLMVRAIQEVVKLDAWDAMIEARRRQLQALYDELRRLRVLHMAEVESLRKKRDDGEEQFQLTKLRQQQASVFQRRALAEKALLTVGKSKSRGEVQRTRAALLEAESTDVLTEIDVQTPSLQIANHDMQLHERFIKGKSADVEYLKEEANDRSVGGGQVLVEAVAAENEASPPAEENVEDNGDDQVVDLTKEAQIQSKKKKRGKRPFLRELPHSYVRLECAFEDGEIRGAVRIEYNDGSVYEGPWVEDVTYDARVDAVPFKTRRVESHWGKFTFHDGTVWEGEAVDNFFSPFTASGSQFRVTTADGHVYTGDARGGQFHGFGTLKMHYTFTSGEYVGEWCDGKRQGYGIERFENGELYEGYWSLDLYHGHGEIVYDDGSKYEGFFRQGKWHGEGVRTLSSGDRIIGMFADGFLNGSGMMEFADGRHYAGEFVNTRRHGVGSLTFANGDRYEGPFDHDIMHGEGKWITKGSAGEPLERLGKWVNGERVAWLSKPSSQLTTATFIEYFAVVKNVEGEMEMDLVIPKFKTPYAVMVARMLPALPEGVDGSDAFVQAIVKLLAKTQNVVVGAERLDASIAEHAAVSKTVEGIQVEYERLRNNVDAVEREVRAQARVVADRQQELDEKVTHEQEMQVKVENFWKYQDKQQFEKKYKLAVDRLHACEVMDWYNLRTATLDDVYMSLLEAFAVLLNFTTNFYLAGKPYAPTKDDILKLLSSNEENVYLGDKEGLIHRYNVKALYVLPLFDAYSFGEGVRQQMLHAITPVIHHPRLRPNNVRLHQLSPALAAVCVWVRAAFFYAKKAIEIAPVVKRLMEQLVIVDHLKTQLEKEREVLKSLETQADEVRGSLDVRQAELEAVEKQQRDLAKTIQDIEALDQAEHTPMDKARIKKPQSYRPASANLAPAKNEDDAEDDEEGDDDATKEEKKKAEVAAVALVNRRQVFEESHGESSPHKVTKEHVLLQILEDAELSAEFEVLKKEVRKVIDRCAGKVAVDEFPARFEEIMLKPLEPLRFGVKKMRTLLLLMDDACVLVEPAREGDMETVQFPVEEDDEPMVSRQQHFCRLCPGVSYATRDDLLFHERTKWHYWNLEAKCEGRPLAKFTLAATYWTEAYDSVDNAICYYNKMTGQVVKSEEPPREVQANELAMELLVEQSVVKQVDASERSHSAAEDGVQHVEYGGGEHEGGGRADEGEDVWEEVADDAGNVYFYNRLTGESSWTKPAMEPAMDSVAVVSGVASADADHCEHALPLLDESSRIQPPGIS